MNGVASASATGDAPARVRIELAIQGMTCAACTARIERKLSRLDQVSAAVNLATERATIAAPAGMPVADLIGAVEAAGYSAAVVGGDGEGPDEAAAGAAYLWRRLVVALVFFVPLSDLSLMLSLLPRLRFPGWQWVLIVLAVPVVAWAAWPFHRAALANARHRGVSMDTLVSLGIIAATGWSVYAMFVLDRAHGLGASGAPLAQLVHGAGGGIYLEVAATVTTFLLAGRFYEARARRIAGEAMRDLAAAGPRCRAQPGRQRGAGSAARLRPGDMIVVRPGEKIAADGTVLFGQSAVDVSMMTGESVPADAAEGDQVTGGTIALTGRLVVRADRVGPDTQLAQLIRLVERAQADKAAVQRLADRICGVFVPAVLVLAAATLAGWLLAGSPAARAFSAGLAVLIIACPCALGLATPAALIVACGRGARLGIFIKGCEALESSRSIDTVVLDKTGTVTTGQMTVTGVATTAGTGRPELLALAAAVERASEHPVAAAITAAAGAGGAGSAQADGFRALPGLGARGIVDGVEVLVGRERLLRDQGLAIPEELTAQRAAWEQAGHTAVLIGWDGQARGAVAVADTVRPSARGAVAELRRLGLRPVLLTGDSEATARTVAAAAGIDEVIAEVQPAQKADYIARLRRPPGGHGRRRRQRRARPGRRHARAGHRVRHRRRHHRGGPDPAAR